ncbi:MAG: holo-ACP synthase [Alphaproteobacteria bacterium]|jgi:holo-[acyl-carrier protein] synthase|nr:holo-ACP synthase [Candidatus Jidaibacter sp.]
MIFGVGCDIVANDRVKALLQKNKDAFLKKIFTKKELEAAPVGVKELGYFAKRYAAKEAAAKALGTGIGVISFTEIEILNDEQGKPICTLLKDEYAHLEAHVSLSDEESHSLAFIVIESKS